MTFGHGLFVAITGVALSFFSYNAQRLVRYMRTVGGPDDRANHPWTRLKNLVLIGIGQTKILRDPGAGILHASVFWGFVVLTIGTAEIIAGGLFPGFSYALILPAPLYYLYLLSQELFALLVLAAVGALLYRRLVIKPKRLQGDNVHSGDAIFILSMIAGLMLSLIFLGGFEYALTPATAMAVKPVSFAFSKVFAVLPVGALEAGAVGSMYRVVLRAPCG